MLRRELELQHSCHTQRPTQIETAVCCEIPERVRDQTIAIELHAPQHVRPVADHSISPGVDDCACPAPKISPRLASQRLCHLPSAECLDSLSAPVERDEQKINER